jgi:hypothetical protein
MRFNQWLVDRRKAEAELPPMINWGSELVLTKEQSSVPEFQQPYDISDSEAPIISQGRPKGAPAWAFPSP